MEQSPVKIKALLIMHLYIQGRTVQKSLQEVQWKSAVLSANEKMIGSENNDMLQVNT